MTEPLHDVARIGHAELLTPKPDESLRFFVDVFGMTGPAGAVWNGPAIRRHRYADLSDRFPRSLPAGCGRRR